MLYNALATKWYKGYKRKPRFCILPIKNSAMQPACRQAGAKRHHTTDRQTVQKPPIFVYNL